MRTPDENLQEKIKSNKEERFIGGEGKWSKYQTVNGIFSSYVKEKCTYQLNRTLTFFSTEISRMF